MMSRFLSPARSAARSMIGTDPFSDLQREMARLVDDFMGTANPTATASPMAPLRLDVRESPQEVCVSAELPGVKPEAVEIRMDGNLLTIRGEKSEDVQQHKDDYHLMERSYGRFQRTIQLPYTPDPEHVRAEFDNGVLTVHVPKEAQQERSRKIEIQSHPTQVQQPHLASSAGAAPAGSETGPH